MIRSVVAHAPVGLQRRQPARWHYFHDDLMIFAVVYLVLGRIADNIAVAKFDPDFLGDIGQLYGISVEHAAASLFGMWDKSPGPPASSAVLPPPKTPIA